MDPKLGRVLSLMDMGCLSDAEQELRMFMGENPEDAQAHAVLALILWDRGKRKEAFEEVEGALGLDPEDPYPVYVYCTLLLAAKRLDEADEVASELIEAMPESMLGFELRAKVALRRHDWNAALEAADAALRIDSDDEDSMSLRAQALVKLGKREEAMSGFDEALALSPNDDSIIAEKGWCVLECGDVAGARELFLNALRIDPNNESAKAGIVDSIKVKNFLYRLILKYFFWTGTLGGQARTGFLIGIWLIAKILRVVAKTIPTLQPFIIPVILLYVVFVLTTWLADPLTDLIMRFHPLGRHALSRKQIQRANFVGLVILGTIAFMVGFIAAPHQFVLLLLSLGCAALIFPVSGTFGFEPGSRERRFSIVYLIALIAVGASAAASMLFGGGNAVATGLGIAYFIGCVGYTWIASLILSNL